MSTSLEHTSEWVYCAFCDGGCECCEDGKVLPQAFLAVPMPDCSVDALASVLDGFADGLLMHNGLLVQFSGVRTGDIRREFLRFYEHLHQIDHKWVRDFAHELCEASNSDKQFAKNWTADGLTPLF